MMLRIRTVRLTSRLSTVCVNGRQIHGNGILSAASVFRMPAMSPTMTEGGVVSWKFKPGESFGAGDVLLEVETDKATIDVEAQDDGVLWEILEKEGAKGIPVGKAIALTAEPGDDLASLEKPPLDDKENAPSASKKEAIEEESTTEASESPASRGQEELKPHTGKNEQAPEGGDGVFQKANPGQKLFPSVELLLHENSISVEDALSKIPASGPHGRLLKGDVLAYLGKIDKTSIVSVSNFIRSREKQDLSHIELAESSASSTKQEKSIEKPKNVLNFEFSTSFGEDISNEKFKYALQKAILSATRSTYAHNFPEYASSPVPLSLNAKTDFFEDILVPSVTKSRFLIYDLHFQFFGSAPPCPPTVDDFDFLLGVKPQAKHFTGLSNSVAVTFKLKYDDSLSDSLEFVDYFKRSLLSQIPAKNLLISQ